MTHRCPFCGTDTSKKVLIVQTDLIGDNRITVIDTDTDSYKIISMQYKGCWIPKDACTILEEVSYGKEV